RSFALSTDGPVREDDEQAQDALREQEAATVAALCGRLLGQFTLEERGVSRLLAPRDIALLTQTGTELWRYERALEARGIPIVSQAGKGFFHRQEVQDLINLTRVLAEPHDTLALGAFLRGPCVGLSDRTLLDITLALAQATPAVRKPVLRLWTPLDTIVHPLARAVLETLQMLARRARRTTPYLLLAEAVDALNLRAVLLNRHPVSPERALGNIDRLLELARPWDSAGLRAFAHYLRARWEDAESEVEARADLHENAVHLITAHSAKGLEWPVVVVINSFSKTNNRSDAVLLDRETQTLVAKLGPVPSRIYVKLKEIEKQELARERVRLLYVACTRAKHLLLLPQLDPKNDSWFSKAKVDVAADTTLEAPDEVQWPFARPNREFAVTPDPGTTVNTQTARDFSTESALIADHTPQLAWH
ncbi:MAG: ATP-dependent endonuclease, partial [Betaproteobacteria bacterium]|nr:ATP-dependent endonuclease [Betaproteobacteria bacterium]